MLRGSRSFEASRARREPGPFGKTLPRLLPARATWTQWRQSRSGRSSCESSATGLEEEGLGPVIHCGHFSGLLILVACSGERPTRLLQLDVYSRHLFRGAPVVTADELVPLAELEERGYRRLRPGAEALLLLLRRLPRGGRAPAPVARTPILELLRADPAGAAELAALLGFPARALRAFEAGGWDSRSSIAFEMRAASRLLLHPRDLRACIALDYRRLRGCSLVEALEQGRRVEGDRSEWLSAIGKTHLVEETPPPTP